MTVSPSKGKKLQTAFLFAIVVCAFILMQSIAKWSWIIAVFFLVPFVICIRQWIATGRTFLFAAEGITVKFLWHTRFIPWREIGYVGIFHCDAYREFGCLYAKGIEFLPGRSRRPRRMGVGLYAALFSPMQYIYLYFGPQTDISKRNGYPPEYEVDEAVFRELLKKWDVNVEESPRLSK